MSSRCGSSWWRSADTRDALRSLLEDRHWPSGLDGYEVGRRVHNPLGTSVRLIALTGHGPDDRTRSADMGFDAHLVKPVSPGEMRDALTVYGRVDEGPIAVRVS